MTTLALACCLPLLHAVFFLGDEGILLRGAAEMVDGKRLYRDVFEFYPPGGPLITSAWLAVFGRSFAAARMLAVVSVAGIACLTYLACAAASETVLLPAGLVGLWLLTSQGRWTIVDHHWLTTLFSMIAAWITIVSVRGAELRPRLGFFAGLASGAAAMVTPTRGVLSALASLGSLVERGNRKMVAVACVAGCLVAPLLCLAFIVLTGSLSAAYADIIGFTATGYAGIQGARFATGATLATLPLALLYPLAILIALLVVAREGRAALSDRPFRACLLLAGAGFLGLYPRPDIVHISFAAPLAMPLAAIGIRRITDAWRPSIRYAVGGLALVLCLPTATSYMSAARAIATAPGSPTAAGRIAFFEDADAPALFAFLATTPRSDGFFFYPYMPLAPFIAQRQHVSRYDLFLPSYTTPAQYAEACASVEARATWVVLDRSLMDDRQLKTIFPATRDVRPPERRAFENMLEHSFRPVAEIGHYEIRKRVGSMAPAQPPPAACRAA